MKKIAVWGAVGTGKSFFSLSLAHALSGKKQNVIVISPDRTSPMASSFLPQLEFSVQNSLGNLLSGDITTETLKKKLKTNKDNSYVAFLTLGGLDSYQRYKNNWVVSKINTLMNILEQFSDYIIFDLSSNFILDNFSLYGLQHSDTVFALSNAENKSTDFYISYKTLLENEERYNADRYINVLNNYYEYSPYKQYVNDFDIQYLLPHARDVYTNYLSGSGNILNVSDKESIYYKREIEKIIKEVIEIE